MSLRRKFFMLRSYGFARRILISDDEFDKLAAAKLLLCIVISFYVWKVVRFLELKNIFVSYKDAVVPRPQLRW